MPDSGTPCDEQAENSVCVWQIDYLATKSRGYRALGCYAGLKGKVWAGGEEQRAEPFSALDANCPKQAQVLGAACPNIDAQSGVEVCIYPAQYCECSSISPGQWLCAGSSLGGSFSPPRPVERACAPTYIDETQLVKDMGPKLTALWCAWSEEISGKLAVELSGKDSPGVADSYEYQTFSTPELDLCLADLPSGLCSSNLDSLGRQCTATIGELDDCVETILATKTGGWVGHGCAPLLANPSCAGVLVQPFTDQGKASKCVVPLQ
jgi:hypothetical protein